MWKNWDSFVSNCFFIEGKILRNILILSIYQISLLKKKEIIFKLWSCLATYLGYCNVKFDCLAYLGDIDTRIKYFIFWEGQIILVEIRVNKTPLQYSLPISIFHCGGGWFVTFSLTPKVLLSPWRTKWIIGKFLQSQYLLRFS